MEKVPDEESRIGGNGMSARIKMCVLRVPCEKVEVEDPWAFSEEHEDFFPAWDPYPHFAVAPTEHRFIDYVLSERLAQGESYGKTRGLTPAERKKYKPVFRNLFPDINMSDVRFVEFCWYDGCEAPDYYEGSKE